MPLDTTLNDWQPYNPLFQQLKICSYDLIFYAFYAREQESGSINLFVKRAYHNLIRL